MAGYGYATVEKALAKVFNADPGAQRGALRGRIKHLQRLGLTPKRPDKGRIIKYSDAAVWAWMIALELEEFGLDPTIIASLIKSCWDYLLKLIKLARKEPQDDVIVGLETRFLSRAWLGDPKFDPAVFTYCQRSGADYFFEFLEEDQRRACIFNLSARLRKLDEALREILEKENKAL
jgi:hypothetical protein